MQNAWTRGFNSGNHDHFTMDIYHYVPSEYALRKVVIFGILTLVWLFNAKSCLYILHIKNVIFFF